MDTSGVAKVLWEMGRVGLGYVVPSCRFPRVFCCRYPMPCGWHRCRHHYRCLVLTHGNDLAWWLTRLLFAVPQHENDIRACCYTGGVFGIVAFPCTGWYGRSSLWESGDALAPADVDVDALGLVVAATASAA
jgi:hypothetical protein